MESASAQKKMADYNAAVAEQGAAAARDKAAYDEAMHREQVRKILSTQRALFGVSGVDMTGSPLLVMEDTAKKSELDALAIRYGGDVAAARERSQANLSRMQGEAVKTSSYYQAGSTLLQGASNTYGNYQKMTGKITAPTVVSR
jgi:hypothetical protein